MNKSRAGVVIFLLYRFGLSYYVMVHVFLTLPFLGCGLLPGEGITEEVRLGG